MLKRLQNLVFLFSFLTTMPALACSSFEFNSGGQGGVAHNFDWYTGLGYTAAFFVNARNVTKSGLNLYNSDPVAQWTSKYGSVTYSLVGREFPVGGQNEKGLVVHTQQIAAAQYPTGSLPVLDALQWIQYVLDTSASVDEALQNAALIRPNSTILQLHYFLCDSTQACAVVEFVNGQMMTYSNLSIKALTNTDYPDSVNAWTTCQAETSCNLTDNSLERFVQAAGFNASYDSHDVPTSYALSGLNTLAQTSNPITRYHFFNPAVAVGTVYFMGETQTAWQTMDMSKMDYSCAGAGQYLEINLTATGDQTANFLPYDPAEQQKLVAQTPAQPAWVPQIVNYPMTTICQDPAN